MKYLMDKVKARNIELAPKSSKKVEKPKKESEHLKKMQKGVTEGVSKLGVEQKGETTTSFETRIDEASEMLGDAGESWGDGGDSVVTPVQSQTQQAAQMVQIKAALKSLPTEHRMRRAVEIKLTKEIRKLNKKINKAVDNPHELNNLIARIRELRHFIYRLATATYDVVKSIYLKVIHGIA